MVGWVVVTEACAALSWSAREVTHQHHQNTCTCLTTICQSHACRWLSSRRSSTGAGVTARDVHRPHLCAIPCCLEGSRVTLPHQTFLYPLPSRRTTTEYTPADPAGRSFRTACPPRGASRRNSGQRVVSNDPLQLPPPPSPSWVQSYTPAAPQLHCCPPQGCTCCSQGRANLSTLVHFSKRRVHMSGLCSGSPRASG